MQLTVNEFNLIENMFSFAIGVFGVSALFFLLQRNEVAPRYRVMLTLLFLVSVVACYNYVRLFEGWNNAFTIVNGEVRNTGHIYDDTFRYADWLLTVPLLLVALVLSLDMPARQARLRALMLASLAVEMIALGYPGQISASFETRWLWWTVSMVPFTLIVYQLLVSLASAIRNQPPGARALVSAARFVTIIVWCFYPLVFIMPMLGVTGKGSFVIAQVGYALADIVAKACYGMLLYAVVAQKSSPAAVAMLDMGNGTVRPIRAQAG